MFGQELDRLHRYKRLDARLHGQSIAVRLFPNVVPLPGFANPEPAALGRPPYDCGLEYFDRANRICLHARSPARRDY
jgi:hypothetical protein